MTAESTTSENLCGWHGTILHFVKTSAGEILRSLSAFVADASPEQVTAWRESIRLLQAELALVCDRRPSLSSASIILEYELPLEARRIDAVICDGGTIWVIEFKGRPRASAADLDQVAAYARDLRCYHALCHTANVVPLLIMTSSEDSDEQIGDVLIGGRGTVSRQLAAASLSVPATAVTTEAFLAPEAYRPLPSLIEAARELFQHGDLRPIRRARAATDPAATCITSIIHDAARTRSRRLVLLTGLPGAGKTLVGLRVVHSHFLDDLAVARANGKPSAPAVFLSGNGPLVDVLQYELRSAGGDGKAFVRGVKDYVRQYSGRQRSIPPEHVLVFDEAQRAWDAARVADGHNSDVFTAKSEPHHFIDFAERIPEWCVVIGLIGGGQEIHVGEEAGIGQWREALDSRGTAGDWTVHGPPHVQESFGRSRAPFEPTVALHLDTELRFHAASDLHEYVAGLLGGANYRENASRAEALRRSGYRLRISRDLDVAKQYLRSRYVEDPTARFGLVASSKDKDLMAFGVTNDFQSTKRVRFGPWYSDAESSLGGRSCRLLDTCVTEFGAQGLELDASLLAWGTDFRRENGRWSNANARGYRTPVPLRDPFQLRLNSYRVLLTRGRDATIVFVPDMAELDETYRYLRMSGFEPCVDKGE